LYYFYVTDSFLDLSFVPILYSQTNHHKLAWLLYIPLIYSMLSEINILLELMSD